MNEKTKLEQEMLRKDAYEETLRRYPHPEVRKALTFFLAATSAFGEITNEDMESALKSMLENRKK